VNHAERLRQLADRMGLDGYAEELREIAGEMEAQPPAQAEQWQPIDTAPRDEPFLAVLLCGDHRMICTMRRAVADAKNSRPDGDGFHVERVTHWMPLPPPPATLKGQQ
jgi:Protein of unknown function (DUF551)